MEKEPQLTDCCGSYGVELDCDECGDAICSQCEEAHMMEEHADDHDVD